MWEEFAHTPFTIRTIREMAFACSEVAWTVIHDILVCAPVLVIIFPGFGRDVHILVIKNSTRKHPRKRCASFKKCRISGVFSDFGNAVSNC